MKINIIMPTYNDSKTIVEALDSVKFQKYSNWELFIVNDGSTDNTENIVKDYIKKNNLESKITYIYEENSDQLNAIKTALKYIKDDNSLIFILHSDDLLYNDSVFTKVINYFKNNNIDILLNNYDVIDENGQTINSVKIKKFTKKDSLIALQGLWLGRNLFADFAFCKTKVYKEKINYNYLTWNTPFWLNHNMTLLNVQNGDFKTYKYRVYSNNYINNEIGLLNVLNGELRTEINILNNYKIPFYKVQYFFFRLLNKFKINYPVIYSKEKTKNIYPIIKFLISKRVNLKDIKKYPYYEAILNFYFNYKTKREITISNITNKDVFYGSDIRKFNKLMLEDKLPELYYKIFKEMNLGFNKIITNKENKNNLLIVLKFLNIDNYVKVIIEK